MTKAEGIIVDCLTRASIRIHWVFLANLVLAAMVLSSVYARTFSYDLSLNRAAQIFVLDAEEKLREIEARYRGAIPLKKPNETTFDAAPVGRWDEKDKKAYGDLTFRQQRAINVLKNVSMNSAETPIISSKIAPNDFEIFCGILMVALCLWIFFSTNQVNYLLRHVRTSQEIEECQWSTRHILVTVYSTQPLLIVALTVIVIFLPAASMLWSTITTLEVGKTLKTASYWPIVEEAYYRLVLTKQIITGVLLFLGLYILVMWFTVLRNFKEA